jgi:hypothetical protein
MAVQASYQRFRPASKAVCRLRSKQRRIGRQPDAGRPRARPGMHSTGTATSSRTRAAGDVRVFSMDGVVTHTARVEAAAWRTTFDRYLLDLTAPAGVEHISFHPGVGYGRTPDHHPFCDPTPNLETR